VPQRSLAAASCIHVDDVNDNLCVYTNTLLHLTFDQLSTLVARGSVCNF